MQDNILNFYQMTNQLTYTKGRHSIRAGATLENYRNNADQQSYLRGQLQFRSLEDLLRGQPTTLLAQNPFLVILYTTH